MSSPSFPNPSHRPVSLALLLCAVVLMAANLRSPLVALGPVVPFIQDDLGVSASYIGLIAAAPMAVFALFSPLAVWAAKKWGMAQVLPWSMALMMAGIGLRITGPSVDFLLLGTIVLSAAIAAGNVLLPALAKRNLPTRIGLVVGTLSATMSVSAALASAIAVPLAQWQNWRLALVARYLVVDRVGSVCYLVSPAHSAGGAGDGCGNGRQRCGGVAFAAGLDDQRVYGHAVAGVLFVGELYALGVAGQGADGLGSGQLYVAVSDFFAARRAGGFRLVWPKRQPAVV